MFIDETCTDKVPNASATSGSNATDLNGGAVKVRKKEGNVLFNDAFNTFLYRYMASGIW